MSCRYVADQRLQLAVDPGDPGATAEAGRPHLAANHFAGLVLWVPVNRIMFCGDDEHVTDAEVDRFAEAGVRAFLAAYG